MTTLSKSSPPAPSPTARSPRITLQTLRDKKARREPIVMLTAYDFPTARICAAAGIDILLVGDSAATTLLGTDSTVHITLEFLLTLTAAVRRGAPDAFLMADMPFASYPDIPTAVANAARFVREAGADCVKFEMDLRHADLVRALSASGIVTCAHLGLLPQRAAQQGGYVAQARTAPEAQALLQTAITLAQAGAHTLLLEAVPDEVTAEIVKAVPCPVFGCGAGPSADGHVVVFHDMLGFHERVPRFVEKYGEVPAAMKEAISQYAQAVRNRTYPAERHQYHMKK